MDVLRRCAARLQNGRVAWERREQRRASTTKTPNPKDNRISMGLGLGAYDPVAAITEGTVGVYDRKGSRI